MEFDNALPSPGAWGNEHKQYYSKILNANSVVIESYSVSTYSPHDITNTLKTLLLSMDKFRVTLDLESKSNDMKNYLRTSVALHILGLKIFATLSEPIIPDISKMIYKFLGLKLPPAVGDTKFIGPKDFSGLGDTPVFPELKLHKNTSSAKRQEKNEVAT